MPSDRLDDYELGDVLGVGTVGTIYLAVERESGRSVALKKLHQIQITTSSSFRCISWVFVLGHKASIGLGIGSI